jgi:hypothetical protein
VGRKTLDKFRKRELGGKPPSGFLLLFYCNYRCDAGVSAGARQMVSFVRAGYCAGKNA